MTPEMLNAMHDLDILDAPEDMLTVSPAGIRTVSPVGMRTVSRAGVRTVSPADIRTVSPADMRTVSPADMHTVSPAGLDSCNESMDGGTMDSGVLRLMTAPDDALNQSMCV